MMLAFSQWNGISWGHLKALEKWIERKLMLRPKRYTCKSNSHGRMELAICPWMLWQHRGFIKRQLRAFSVVTRYLCADRCCFSPLTLDFRSFIVFDTSEQNMFAHREGYHSLSPSSMTLEILVESRLCVKVIPLPCFYWHWLCCERITVESQWLPPQK